MSSNREQDTIADVEKLMVDTMARYDSSHDVHHVQRVRRTALSIARSVAASSPRRPDLFVVEVAALLHDTLDKKYVSADLASDPFKYFLPFFEEIKTQRGLDLISDGRGKQITEIIDNVSWSTEKKRRELDLLTEWHQNCVELHCVQDADRLDAIGAFGIMRCAAYTSANNSPLHVPAGDPAEPRSAIQHFRDKLIYIRDGLKTEPGKRMGEKRHKLEIVDFLDSVKEEYDALPPTGTINND